MARRRRHDAFDIVTPTQREARADDIGRRRRRYFRIMVPCLVLVVFGFFVPAPVPVRIGALVVAAVLPPVAAIVANAGGRGLGRGR
jgi:Protein of unknown function (DUF3099)